MMARFDSNVKDLQKRFRRAHKLILSSMFVGVKATIQDFVRWVTTRKMLGQSINRITGTAIRSVTASPRYQRLADGARGTYGSNLGYVKALNDGFDGDVQVPQHARRPARKRSKSGRFKRRKAGVDDFAYIRVRAHSRRLRVRARKFFQETNDERRQVALRNLKRSVLIPLVAGRVTRRGDYL